MGEEFAFRAGWGAVQHIERRVFRQVWPQGDCLVQMRDEKVPAAGRRQGRSDACRAETVSIRLDYGGTGGPLKARAQQTPVCADRGKVYGELGAGVFGFGS